MIYLKYIVSRITKDNKIIEYAKSLSSDKEIMEYLTDFIDKKDIISELENYFKITYVPIEEIKIPDKVLSEFDIKGLEKKNAIPYKFDSNTNTYFFAISDITNTSLFDILKKTCEKIGHKCVINFSFEYEIDRAFDFLENNINNSISDEEFDVQVWVNDIINKGIDLNASDIHFENFGTFIQVRYRIDGLLSEKNVFKLSENVLSSISVRIKIISNMDISEKRKPQDGRINNYTYNNRNFDIRVSSVCTILGEKFVMRLIEKSFEMKSFEALGFESKNKEKLIEMLKNKDGIIYLAGATGSGKSTTLYAMINQINSDEINIYTIENPVEKTMEKVNQIEINESAGITYSSILKSLLRQDPDIIVVGEIRDSETANLSVRASLTGHLVLTTIHGNNALDAIGRLIDIGVEPYLISATTIGFISQRLVRKICPDCKRQVEKLKPHERLWLDNVCKEYNLPHYDDNQFFEPIHNPDCKICNNGYRDRIALTEIVSLDDNIKEMILRKEDLTEIRKYAIKNGFKPMVINGIEKSLNGITTISEVIRQLS